MNASTTLLAELHAFNRWTHNLFLADMWTAPPGEWVLTNGVWIPYEPVRSADAGVAWLFVAVGLFVLGAWLWQDANRRLGRGTEGGTKEVG
jgi:hypothetical protein